LKVLITYVAPTFRELVYPQVLDSIWGIDKGEHWLDFIFLTGVPLPNQGDANLGYNLERARQVAVDLGYDYMLIIESDIIVPTTCLSKLILLDADVAVGLTPERYEKVRSFLPIACMSWNNNPDAMQGFLTNNPFEIKGCAGYALTLVKRCVFEKIPFPAKFPCDFTWYDSLHKAGVKVVCDPSVTSSHVERVGRVVSGADSALKFWKIHTRLNELQGKDWFYGLPHRWWWGKTKANFLSGLKDHLDLPDFSNPKLQEFKDIEIGGADRPKYHPNLDANPSVGVDYVIDLNVEDLPFYDATVEHVYSSHCIEHFNFKRAIELLRDCYRVLKTNGTIELVIPDTEKVVRYTANDTIEKDRILFGERTTPYMFHWSWYSQELATFLLQSVGFKDVKIVGERTGVDPCFTIIGKK